MIELFEENHARVRLPKQLFLQCSSLPIGTDGFIGIEHYRIQKGNHGKVRIADIASLVAGGNSNSLYIIQGRFRAPSERFRVRDMLALHLEPNYSREQSLI